MKNYQEYFYNLIKLNNQEKKELYLWLDKNIIGHREREEEIWEKFYPIFKNLSYAERYNFRDSYGYCFSVLASRLFNGFLKNEVHNIFSYTSFLFFLDNIDVWRKIIDYINIKAVDEDETVLLYNNFKKEFFNSKEIIYIENNQLFTVSDLIDSINIFIERDDNLGMAEFFSKLEKKINIRLEELNIKDNNAQNVLSMFKSLVEFFSGTNENNIYNLLYSINNPRQFEVFLDKKFKTNSSTFNTNIIENKIKEDLSVKKLEDKPVVISEKKENDLNIKTVEKDKANLIKETKKDESKKVDYNLIRMDIEMNFDIDDEANFIDLEGVLNKLEELKNKYSDDNILELYYFDEKENRFIWNDKLLNS